MSIALAKSAGSVRNQKNTAQRIAMFDECWRKGLQSTESIADTYEALVSALSATGHLDDTLIVVTSDNGYHAGTHRLGTGKNTAYREDSVVPAVLIGNVIRHTDPAVLRQLRQQLTALGACSGVSCRAADSMPNAVVRP
jgi:membrane-anchored protein YejM (alkaline phosphatase superfamily)